VGAGGDDVDVPLGVALLRERGHGVVGDRGGAGRVLRADGEQVRVERRVGQERPRAAVVPAGDDDEDALAPGRLGRERERVGAEVLGGSPS
jgi:hypothetical protein